MIVIINHLGENIRCNNEFNTLYSQLAQFQLKHKKKISEWFLLVSFFDLKKILVREKGFLF